MDYRGDRFGLASPQQRTHRARAQRREGQGREIQAEAEAHRAPATRGDGAAGQGRRNAALDCPRLQCQSRDDFEAWRIWSQLFVAQGTRMGQEPAYIKNFRVLMKGEPTIEHLEALEIELYASGSDRATAVMLASFLEDHLGRLLKSAMRHPLSSTESKEIFDHRGPLASFDSKIIIAYALNLIGPKTRSDLDLIRNLRNAFAHSRMPYGFQAPEVRAVCNKLQIIDYRGPISAYRYLERVTHQELKSGLIRLIRRRDL